MGKPVTLLERLCEHSFSFGAQSIEVTCKDGREWVVANKDGAEIGIANFVSDSREGEELHTNLQACVKKPIQTILAGKGYFLKVRCFDSSGDEGFAVTMAAIPKPLSFTAKQGQYLAFIYNYTKIHHQAPSEGDMEYYFQVSPPSIHEMIKTLARNGLIEKTPGMPRSIRLLVPPEQLPRLG